MINASQIQRFGAHAQNTLDAALPVSVTIAAVTYAGSSAGEFIHEGLDAHGNLVRTERIEFRIPKTALATAPAPGAIVTRVSDSKAFRLIEVPNRPQETAHRLVCAWLHAGG